jgi:hypothetical protein
MGGENSMMYISDVARVGDDRSVYAETLRLRGQTVSSLNFGETFGTLLVVGYTVTQSEQNIVIRTRDSLAVSVPWYHQILTTGNTTDITANLDSTGDLPTLEEQNRTTARWTIGGGFTNIHELVAQPSGYMEYPTQNVGWLHLNPFLSPSRWAPVTQPCTSLWCAIDDCQTPRWLGNATVCFPNGHEYEIEKNKGRRMQCVSSSSPKGSIVPHSFPVCSGQDGGGTGSEGRRRSL